MKLDSAIKDLQKEKLELEAKLKHVNVTLTALAKLSSKGPGESMESKTENPVNRPAPQATTAKPAPTVQLNKPAGL